MAPKQGKRKSSGGDSAKPTRKAKVTCPTTEAITSWPLGFNARVFSFENDNGLQTISSQQAQSQPSCLFRLENHVISMGGVDVYMEQTFPSEARMENILWVCNPHDMSKKMSDKAVLVKAVLYVSTCGSCRKNMSSIFPKFVNSKVL